MPSGFLSLLKNVQSDSSLAADGTSSAEFSGFIDTGSYIFNALISGTLFGGLPENKITVLAGESTTGKTYLALSIVARWMKANPTGVVVWADTESATTNDMMKTLGLDTNRVIKLEPETIEKFKQDVVAILANYAAEFDGDEAPYPLFIVLDSLGNMSSNKEVGDAQDQKDARDMTKAGLIRGMFRILRLKLAKLRVPMIVTNHTYAVVGAYIPTSVMSGGQGLKYVSDTICFLSKSKERDKETKTVTANLVKVKMEKSRLSRELIENVVRISYTEGLDRYYGLLDMGVEAGLITKGGAGRYTFPGSKTGVTASKVAESPETYFTQEFLEALDAAFVKPHYTYMSDGDAASPTDVEDDDTDE